MEALDAIFLGTCIVYAGSRAAGCDPEQAQDESVSFVHSLTLELSELDRATGGPSHEH
jgi:hypothetical protein